MYLLAVLWLHITVRKLYTPKVILIWRMKTVYQLYSTYKRSFQVSILFNPFDTLILRIKLLNLYVYFFIILVIDEWNNFMERINSKRESEVWGNEENVLQLRHWASLRGQTLCRTGSLVILPYLVSITWLFGTWVIGKICVVYYVFVFSFSFAWVWNALLFVFTRVQ
jgi:hypothetical protein